MATYSVLLGGEQADEVLGGRWTLLVVRELLCGSRRFNDIRRAIPGYREPCSPRDRTNWCWSAPSSVQMVHTVPNMPSLLPSRNSRAWSVRWYLGPEWLVRHAADEDVDPEPLLIDMQRRVRFDALPKDPIVVRFEIERGQPRLMLLRQGEATLCTLDPWFP